ncbi:MAG: hypothetical protein QM723_18380 [Myxococcaceae bacterium]
MLLYCFASCHINDIVGALGLRKADLFNDAPHRFAQQRVHRAAVAQEEERRRDQLSADAAQLYLEGQAVCADDECSEWLKSRGIDPQRVTDFALARALSADQPTPSWAAAGSRSWSQSGHRVLVPLYDHHGRMRSVHARRVVAGDPKELSPRGGSRSGLVMANGLAQLMLRGEPLGDGSPVGELLSQVGLWVAEGTTDFLTACCTRSDADDAAPAVVGVVSGSWTTDMSTCIPDRTPVCIATDDDGAGDKYAAAILESLRERVALGALPAPRRWRASGRRAS